MANPNYRQAKRQKEAARKARQLEKLQKRSVRPDAAPGEPAPELTGGDAPPAPAP